MPNSPRIENQDNQEDNEDQHLALTSQQSDADDTGNEELLLENQLMLLINFISLAENDYKKYNCLSISAYIIMLLVFSGVKKKSR